MEVNIILSGGYDCGFLDDMLLQIDYYSEYGWGYVTVDSVLAEKYGFKKVKPDLCMNEFYFLPIKDIAHTRGFHSTVFCVYKGYKCQFMSSTFNEENQTFCMRLSPDLALAKGYNWNQIGHEIQTMDVHLSDLDEIYRCREKLDDFIFDVDPIKPIYKDGKWLIEPDENGVYVI